MLDGSTGKMDSKAVAIGGQAPRDRVGRMPQCCERGEDKLVVFGGLSGDDSNPMRLNDVWVLEK